MRSGGAVDTRAAGPLRDAIWRRADPHRTTSMYAACVDSALIRLALGMAVAAPLVPLSIRHGADDHIGLWCGYAIHLVVGVLAMRGYARPGAALLSWMGLVVAIAATTTVPDTAHLRAVVDACIMFGIGAALVLPARRALATAAATTLAATACTAALLPATTTVLRYQLATPVYALCGAAAAAVIAASLRRVALLSDRAARAGLDADRALAETRLAARRSRLLHDTVINTLGAIARGRLTGREDAVVARCRADLEALATVGDVDTSVLRTLDEVIEDAAALGVRVLIADRTPVDAFLAGQPPSRRSEILALIREALTNVAKHAQVPVARVWSAPDSTAVHVDDDGVGCADPQALRTSMDARAAHTGVAITVHTLAGTGTSVTITPEIDRPGSQAGTLVASTGPLAASVSAIMLTQFALISIITFVVDRRDTPPGAVSTAALVWTLTAACLVAVIGTAARSGRLSSPVLAIIGATVTASAVLVGTHGMPATCGTTSIVGWSGDAAATLCVVVILVDGRVRVVGPVIAMVVAATTLLTLLGPQGCASSAPVLLVADVLVVAAVVWLRHRLVTMSRAIDHRQMRMRSIRMARDQAAATEALRADGVGDTLIAAAALLHRIAADPAATEHASVRADAEREEGYLRCIAGLPTAAPILTRLLVDLIAIARPHEVRLSIIAAADVDERTAARAREVVARVIIESAPHDAVSMGFFDDEDGPSLTVVAPGVPDGVLEQRV
ncbi:histidine kinase [Gordonia polyisoprenivorans]|uniref:histidine kinase n=1 Tax=Gordonia polyisoprenivorans TaxID=84595 RepID=UPI000B99E0D4|nr:histidine kinase [Gordonia polyisoprenivorans]OZC33840.1 histidine kinase [Gordonia polyisoprenivorans]